MAGTLFIVSAASGAGKTSLVRALIERLEGLQVSISHTTRPMRPGEVDGMNYHFVNEPQFIDMENSGAFLEYAKVFNHRYGTSASWVKAALDRGTDVILEIDWQGARQITQKHPEAVGIFIIPPSLAALRVRLQTRAQYSQAVIEERLAKATRENMHYGEYQYLVVNDDFDVALGHLQAIILAERLRMKRQRQVHHGLLQDLVGDLAGN